MARPKTRDDDLRDRLVAQSISLLEEAGPASVSARRVAASARTSTAAVYELFGNKSGLVASIYSEGFRRLADDLDAIEPTGDPRADLIALFDATRTFAVRSPAMFDVMFSRPFAEFEPDANDRLAARRIYDVVVDRTATLLGATVTNQRTIDAAHALVSLDRGLIAAELSGTLGTSEESITRRRAIALEAMIVGLCAKGGDQ